MKLWLFGDCYLRPSARLSVIIRFSTIKSEMELFHSRIVKRKNLIFYMFYLFLTTVFLYIYFNLESTIITHGMPYPDNLSMAKNVENIIR